MSPAMDQSTTSVDDALTGVVALTVDGGGAGSGGHAGRLPTGL